MTLNEMRNVVARIETKIIESKGPKYLSDLYIREGVATACTGTLDGLKGKVAALTIAAARMDGEDDAARALTSTVPTVTIPTPRQTPQTPQAPQHTGNAAAVAQSYCDLVNGRKFEQAQALFEKNQSLLEGFARTFRAQTPEEAQSIYGYLIVTRQSYLAGKFWQRNRELLTD
jgi:hypothetical protein